jgi:hypothetical protein
MKMESADFQQIIELFINTTVINLNPTWLFCNLEEQFFRKHIAKKRICTVRAFNLKLWKTINIEIPKQII